MLDSADQDAPPLCGCASRQAEQGQIIRFGSAGGKNHFVGIWYMPADDIKTALSRAKLSFNHYWGTKSKYKKPSTKTCDLPNGC